MLLQKLAPILEGPTPQVYSVTSSLMKYWRVTLARDSDNRALKFIVQKNYLGWLVKNPSP